MLSTKSRLLTRFPGTKKRTSIVFSGVKPGTSGQTIGRSSSETKHSAGCGCVAVNGIRISSRGGLSASASILANVAFGTALLSSGIGSPPSVTWKIPCVVRRSLRGLCSTPLATRQELMMSDVKKSRPIGSDSTRARPGRSSVNVRDGSFVTGASCK